MKLEGRRRSTNVSEIRSPRARKHHDRAAFDNWIGYNMTVPKGPTPEQTNMNKKLGAGMPNPSNLKRDRVKKKGK